MTARVLRWLIFSIIFSILPLGLDYLIALARSAADTLPSLSEVIGKGELCLIAVTLSAVGAGEIYGIKISNERAGILLGGASVINITFGIALYVMMKSSTTHIQTYIILSLIIFTSTIIVSTSCIAASEAANV